MQPDHETDVGRAQHDVLARTGTVLSIHTSWQFAAIIQFCRIFGAQLGVKPFSADSLEKALLAPKEQAGRFWGEVIPKLLSRCGPVSNAATLSTWKPSYTTL